MTSNAHKSVGKILGVRFVGDAEKDMVAYLDDDEARAFVDRAERTEKAEAMVRDLEALRELDAVRKEVLHAEIRKQEARADAAEARAKLLDTILRTMHVLAEIECHDELWWRTDGEYAPVRLFIRCNDLFWWACADLEEITAENVHILEESLRDVRSIAGDKRNVDDRIAWIQVPTLFCARARCMRPQGAVYKSINKRLWPLFDACGPEREVGGGNTPKPKEADVP